MDLFLVSWVCFWVCLGLNIYNLMMNSLSITLIHCEQLNLRILVTDRFRLYLVRFCYSSLCHIIKKSSCLRLDFIIKYLRNEFLCLWTVLSCYFLIVGLNTNLYLKNLSLNLIGWELDSRNLCFFFTNLHRNLLRENQFVDCFNL